MEKQNEKELKSIELGFYYHYKHDSNGEINNYSYEVLGITMHSEDRSINVLYRPIYQNSFLGNSNYFIRPFNMFIEVVEKDGKKLKRFVKITDEDIVAKLTEIRDRMYSKN